MVKVTIPNIFSLRYRFPFPNCFSFSTQQFSMNKTHPRFKNGSSAMISTLAKRKTNLKKWKKTCKLNIKKIKEMTNTSDTNNNELMEQLYWRWTARDAVKTMYGNDIIMNEYFPYCNLTIETLQKCNCKGWSLGCLPNHTLLRHYYF